MWEDDVVLASAQIRHRVLLVDDDHRILLSLRLKPMASGYDVITAMTGQGALTMNESQKPDILLPDLKMPGMGGLEVLKTLRASSHLPGIVISAATDLAEEALSLGANDYLPKPFDPDELPVRIETILGARQTWMGVPSSSALVSAPLSAA
jgi:DNA-binding response OmpR family regulator